jgi:hypothetical protein
MNATQKLNDHTMIRRVKDIDQTYSQIIHDQLIKEKTVMIGRINSSLFVYQKLCKYEKL